MSEQSSTESPSPSRRSRAGAQGSPSEAQPAQTQTESDRGQFVSEGDEGYEKGYWGTRDNPFADEEFALTTGPDAPLQDLRGNPVELDEHIDKSAAGAQPHEE